MKIVLIINNFFCYYRSSTLPFGACLVAGYRNIPPYFNERCTSATIEPIYLAPYGLPHWENKRLINSWLLICVTVECYLWIFFPSDVLGYGFVPYMWIPLVYAVDIAFCGYFDVGFSQYKLSDCLFVHNTHTKYDLKFA